MRNTSAFAYEPAFNHLNRVTDARNHELQYAFDSRDNLASIAYQDGTRESFSHDAQGNVLSSTNRRGGVISYTYNSSGQLTSKDYSGTPGLVDYLYAYDSLGNLVSAIDSHGTNTMAHDPTRTPTGSRALIIPAASSSPSATISPGVAPAAPIRTATPSTISTMLPAASNA